MTYTLRYPPTGQQRHFTKLNGMMVLSYARGESRRVDLSVEAARVEWRKMRADGWERVLSDRERRDRRRHLLQCTADPRSI